MALGKAVMAACAHADPAEFKHIYDAKKESIKQKIEAIVTKVWRGGGGQSEARAPVVGVYQRRGEPAEGLPCWSWLNWAVSFGGVRC